MSADSAVIWQQTPKSEQTFIFFRISIWPCYSVRSIKNSLLCLWNMERCTWGKRSALLDTRCPSLQLMPLEISNSKD
jgi:hypothetical protein